MKNIVLATALALVFSGAHAAVLQIESDGSFSGTGVPLQATASVTAADLAVVTPARLVEPVTGMSELPEPEVFAMMLLGLCLIGYRASRDSDEKFK